MKTKDRAKLERNSEKAARFLSGLASAPRLMVLCQLVNGEKSVGELWSSSELSQSAFSQHLAKLRQEGLVATRKESQTVYYRLANDDVEKIITVLYEIHCKK